LQGETSKVLKQVLITSSEAQAVIVNICFIFVGSSPGSFLFSVFKAWVANPRVRSPLDSGFWGRRVWWSRVFGVRGYAQVSLAFHSSHLVNVRFPAHSHGVGFHEVFLVLSGQVI
jgi:hypothetical protein